VSKIDHETVKHPEGEIQTDERLRQRMRQALRGEPLSSELESVGEE
jgi:hypothetical protein